MFIKHKSKLFGHISSHFLATGMLFFVLGVPMKAEAGLISTILGREANAEPVNVMGGKSGNNSQTMALLQANTSNILKQDKKIVEPDINTNNISNNALLPTATPSAPSGEVAETHDYEFDQVSVYIVRKGDTISQIADMFGVSVNTILSANDMKKGEPVKEGDILLILPFSGVEHTVTKGQTLKGIAALYKIELGDILAANNIEIDESLVVGDKLIIPGAETSTEIISTPKKVATTTKPKTTSSTGISVSGGFFKNPVPGARRTRGITATHKGVDLAAPEGTPIHAAAPGKVLVARTGWNGGFGNMVILQHDNGTKTLYAHMVRIAATAGDNVAQGETIGYVGNTGSSRGNHLHIEVLGGKNPF